VKIWDTHSKLQQSKKKAGKKFCSQAQEISCTTGVLKKKKKLKKMNNTEMVVMEEKEISAFSTTSSSQIYTL
jgi:hypothetical protein